MRDINNRKATLYLFIFEAVFLMGIAMGGQLLAKESLVTDFSSKNIAPCLNYPFGTDWMGRNMFIRTVTGLSLSIRIGLLTASISAVFAFILGTAAATMGKAADSFINFLIDFFMGIPHILLLILISFAWGKGFKGVVIGISLTHWMSLARLIRAEVLQLKESTYIKAAQKLGINKVQIVWKHMVPHLLPQFITGLILLFPHAILHEASITFLGFGLSLEQPAIGVILSEGLKYLAMGEWWLALFPGLFLMFTVVLFNQAGGSIRKLIDPNSVHE